MALNTAELLSGARRTQRVLWIAFLGATALYVVVALVLGQNRSGEGIRTRNPQALSYIFYAVGAVIFAGALLIRRRLDDMALPDAVSAVRGSTAALVAGLAIMDAVPLLGLVLVFLGGEMREALPLLAGGLIGMILLRPNAAGLEERLRSTLGG